MRVSEETIVDLEEGSDNFQKEKGFQKEKELSKNKPWVVKE